eukprot:TRINITY_DN1182_c0_g2_i1.p1 TRINITY_DN1182_c0_g2~~TRINITY_DN1182_c0_g2_i1.p1  ORF type:complete len:408 (-),score=60.55 TRINITY_DN1182_c0_g2_i1:203-1426(-)
MRIGGNRFVIGKKIGSGSFGSIFMGTVVGTNEEVAIKLESAKTKHQQLLYEARNYNILSGGVGIPNICWYGVEGDYNVMVMDLLGPSLEDLFNFCHRKFSLKTVLMLADQMLRRLEYIHSKNLIHRDVKPDNFVVGVGKKAHLTYIIDFGLSKQYRDPKTHAHIVYREHKSLTGTARYASIYTHLGVEQSRRDDLESLGYVIMYFLRGTLPWQGLKANNKKQKYDRISEKKLATPVEVLCKGYPAEFATYLNYARSLRFADKPDYAYLRKLFRDLAIREGYQFDCVYDWAIVKRPVEIPAEPVVRVVSLPAAVASTATTGAPTPVPTTATTTTEKETEKGKAKHEKKDKIKTSLFRKGPRASTSAADSAAANASSTYSTPSKTDHSEKTRKTIKKSSQKEERQDKRS